MASHYHQNHHHHHHRHPPPPSTHCCCSNGINNINNNPSSYTCCTPPSLPSPPPQQYHHLLQVITSLLSQQHLIPTHLYPHHHNPLLTQTHPQNQNQHQQHSPISSLLHRIESLESYLNNDHHTHHHHSSSHSLRDTAARIIQTHFRSFLARRSKTLRHLKQLAFIKSNFNSLKSSFSNETHLDFAALSHKAMDLLLQLDSIEGCDPMVMDGKRSISRDLVQFLDSIERVALKKHLFCVKSVKNAKSGQKVNKSRDSSDDEKRKLLQNLRGRVDRISRLCKVAANDEDLEPEGIHHVGHDDDVVPSVLISRRNGVSPNKNRVFVQRQEVQPREKKSVRFAENGKFAEVYSSNTYEPDLSGDVACMDGSSSSDDQGEVLENVGCAIEDVLDSSHSVEDDEDALAENGTSRQSIDDWERNSSRDLKNDSRNMVKGQLQVHQEKLLFSAPLPLKMENKADLMKSKGVKNLP